MTHNPAAAHPRLLALIEGMEQEHAERHRVLGAIESGEMAGQQCEGGYLSSERGVYRHIFEGDSSEPITCQYDLELTQRAIGGATAHGYTPRINAVSICDTYTRAEDGPIADALNADLRALPPLLADLRTRAEEYAADWQRMDTAVTHWRREIEMLSHGPDGGDETIYPPRPYRSDEVEKPATAHHACCTTALAAAAGTPALALLAGGLQGAME